MDMLSEIEKLGNSLINFFVYFNISSDDLISIKIFRKIYNLLYKSFFGTHFLYCSVATDMIFYKSLDN